MTRIRFRDFVLTPDEKVMLFDKYAKEAGGTSLKALNAANRNLRAPKELEVPPLDPNQVAKDLGHPVEFKYKGERFVASGTEVVNKEKSAN